MPMHILIAVLLCYHNHSPLGNRLRVCIYYLGTFGESNLGIA